MLEVSSWEKGSAHRKKNEMVFDSSPKTNKSGGTITWRPVSSFQLPWFMLSFKPSSLPIEIKTRVSAAWKNHGKWFLFSEPGIVMEFVKSDKSHGKVMDFLNTDFEHQNAYLPTSLFLPYLVWFLDYLVMDLHDVIWSWKSHRIYCALGANTL